jgi:hypothetical protein
MSSNTIWRNLAYSGQHYRYTTSKDHGAVSGLVLTNTDTRVKKVIPYDELEACAKEAGLGEVITHGSKNPVVAAPAVVAFLRANPNLAEYQPKVAVPA